MGVVAARGLREWPTSTVALVASGIGVAAVGLRVWRLAWGLADGQFFPDEALFSGRAADFVPLSAASFHFPPGFHYGPLYGYLAGMATALAHSLGVVPVPHRLAPATILVTRAVSAAFGVATVGVVGLAAARMYSPAVGLAAAALMSVTALHALHAHIAATDVTLTAFASLTLLAAHAFHERPSALRAAAAGTAAGLAFTIKYPGLALLVPVGWVVLEHCVRVRAPRAALRPGLAALAGFGLTVAVVGAFWILRADEVVAELRRIPAILRVSTFSNNRLVPSLGWYGRPYLYQLSASLPFALGWPLYLLALAGVGMAIRRRSPADRLILAAVVPYFAVIGASSVVFPRYLLPILPGLVMLAARAACALPRHPRAVVLATVWLYSLVFTASQVARFSFEHRKALARFIAEATAQDRARPVRVAVPFVGRGRARDYFDLKAPLGRAGLQWQEVEDGHWLDGRPRAFVLPEWKAIAIRRDRPDGSAARELDQLESGAAGYRVAWRWRSWFLQRDVYTWLDPAFAGDLWQGEIGYTVYMLAPG